MFKGTLFIILEYIVRLKLCWVNAQIKCTLRLGYLLGNKPY